MQHLWKLACRTHNITIDRVLPGYLEHICQEQHSAAVKHICSKLGFNLLYGLKQVCPGIKFRLD